MFIFIFLQAYLKHKKEVHDTTRDSESEQSDSTDANDSEFEPTHKRMPPNRCFEPGCAKPDCGPSSKHLGKSFL